MNILNDQFLGVLDDSVARATAERDLEECEAIETLDISTEQKCGRLLKLIGHDVLLHSTSESVTTRTTHE